MESQQAVSAGDFGRAEGSLKGILQLRADLSPYIQALVHNALGYVYYETGRFREALEQYRIANGLVADKHPGTLQIRISLHINQALYYKYLGDYIHSLEYNNEALRLMNQIPEWDDLSFGKYSAILLNKGISLHLLGEHQEALDVLIDCARVKEEHDHPYLGSAYFNLARVYQALDQPGPCRSYYLRSIERWSSEYDPDYYELANVYLHYGQFLSARGETKAGFGYLQKALLNYQRNYGNRHPLTAACYEAMARQSLEEGRFIDALDYLQQALCSVVRDFHDTDGLSNPDIDNSLHDLTLLSILDTKASALERISENQNSPEEKLRFIKGARESNQLSIDLYHRIRDSYPSVDSRLHMISRQKDIFHTGIRLDLTLYELTGLEQYKVGAFLTAMRGKSGELMFEMQNKEGLYLGSLSDTLAIHARELQQEIAHLGNLIQTEALKMHPDSVRMLNWQDQLFHARDSLAKLMEQLGLDNTQLGQLQAADQDFSLDRIRRKLHRDETLVEYFLTGSESNQDYLHVFVLTKRNLNTYRTALDSSFYGNLEILLDKLHRYVPYEETRERADSLKLALYEIYQDIIAPVRPYFKGSSLIIVPDERLSYIPFDALITQPGTGSLTAYAGISFLLHDYDISYMYNSQLMEHRYPRSWRLPRVNAWIPEHVQGAANTFDKLKGAEEEVRDILDIVNGSRLLRSPDKKELVSYLQEPSILHMAMHSLATDPQGTSPYFLLDTVQDPLLSNRMFDYEINALRITAPMVVLSSCETAGGELQRGEGIMSLSRSFLQAGASSVVHSLWPVEDAKSRELMAGFYREIKRGKSKRSALSTVKRLYLENQPPFYTHPYYWAAFQVTGDTSPLYNKKRVFLMAGFILLFAMLLYWIRTSFLPRR